MNEWLWFLNEYPLVTPIPLPTPPPPPPRAGNSGGTREPSSQKEFGFAESFFDFEVLTELNSKNVSESTAKIICFA